MDNLLAYVISLLAGVTVALVARPAWLLLSGLAGIVFSDLPQLTGSWKATFNEPTESAGTEEMEERIRLRQLGRIVCGRGHVSDSRGRMFRYRGTIKRHTLSGTYHRIGDSTASGAGTFQLQISQNDRRMTGWCLWLDADTERVESSRYTWDRQ